jgi:cell division protein FtsN
MKNKDFREIQVSSSLLVVIFLGVLALGVFIFLLGVSVGKRQAAASGPTRIVTQQIPEPGPETPPKTLATEAAAAKTSAPSAAAPQNVAPSEPPPSSLLAKSPAEDTSAKAPAPKPSTDVKKAATPPSRGLYYVQVLAVADRVQAQATADKYRKQGYTVLVVEPPAGEVHYKVRLGGYPTRDRANELKNKLNAAAGGRTDFWVVQY